MTLFCAIGLRFSLSSSSLKSDYIHFALKRPFLFADEDPPPSLALRLRSE